MSAKRSRNGGSSSFGDSGDSGGSNHHLLPQAVGSDPRRHVREGFGNGAKALKPSPEAEKSLPSVLRMSSPETLRMGRASQVDEFLEQCFFCHRHGSYLTTRTCSCTDPFVPFAHPNAVASNSTSRT